MKFIISKLLWMVPSLGVLSILIFILHKHTESDPTLSRLTINGITPETHSDFNEVYKKTYEETGENKPLFYFTLVPKYFPDNVRGISDPHEREITLLLLKEGYAYKDIQGQLRDSTYTFQELKGLLHGKQQFHLPKLVWAGTENQYHRWFMKFVKGDWGISYHDGLPVISKLRTALSWTLACMVLHLIVLLLAPWPFLLWVNNNFALKLEKLLSFTLFVIPLFLLATIVQVYLTNDYYGMQVFGGGREGYISDPTFLDKMNQFLGRYLPALVCISLLDLAIILRLFRSHIQEISGTPYIKMALAKGLTRTQTLRSHIIPNILLPYITILSGAIPSFIAGSLIVEVIFNIPGMGRLIYQSIQKADTPTLLAAVMIIGFATMVSYLLGDIAYRRADPRIH